MDDISMFVGFAVLEINILAANPAHVSRRIVSRRMKKHYSDLRRRDHRSSVAQEAICLL